MFHVSSYMFVCVKPSDDHDHDDESRVWLVELELNGQALS